MITIVLAATTAVVNYALAIDEDEWWYRHVVSRQARRRGEVTESEVPGLLLLEIDGLAHDVLLRAIRDGTRADDGRAGCAPAATGCSRWETDWSSQTGACQAGILHGSNDDMPAFRWWEKERGRAIVTNHPRDAEELERRHSDGRGLLHADGASRANILSGDAPHSMLTMSTALSRRRPLGRDYSAYFARPYAVARTLVLAFADIARERRAARAQVRDDVRPRIARSRTYALMRAWATVVQRDLQVATVIGDVLAGRPSIYTTFLAYDEVAHHSGIERPDALAVLHDLDRQIARIATACAEAPRPYRLVVLSDHGQSQGETFRDRFGQIARGAGARELRRRPRVRRDRRRRQRALLPRAPGSPRSPATTRWRAGPCARRPAGQVADGAVMLDEEDRREADPRGGRRAAGALGDGLRLPRPGQLPAPAGPRLAGADRGALPGADPDPARATPGIGFVLVRSEADGALAIGAAASTTSTPSGSRARTRWPRSGPTPPATCAAPTPSRTAPT